MTGSLVLNEDPETDMQAATKHYVDNSDVWYYGAVAPENKKLLWIDSDENQGGLKRFDASSQQWVHIEAKAKQ